jgi:hypothetical protein
MRTTVDIPDPLYRRLKTAAATRGCSVKSLVLRSVRASLERRPEERRKRRVKLPLVVSKRPGWLRLDNRVINEVLFP